MILSVSGGERVEVLGLVMVHMRHSRDLVWCDVLDRRQEAIAQIVLRDVILEESGECGIVVLVGRASDDEPGLGLQLDGWCDGHDVNGIYPYFFMCSCHADGHPSGGGRGPRLSSSKQPRAMSNAMGCREKRTMPHGSKSLFVATQCRARIRSASFRGEANTQPKRASPPKPAHGPMAFPIHEYRGRCRRR